ncbi:MULTISPECIES: hypothetical protein [unclassified Streptomyces]|uniref:hypothetical protein n=1 Tax=unclassified Streptomyces TaxID=2593676 RepID=UPI0022AF201F|nr:MULTISPECIES: hypothetical protein [unclassified Streptomyces]MCZ4097322.1 hypothetical protein [Streptomyces sp. H39-C1]MCZ4120626.1 hypothetical protein [Streptomyces sp. H39-S7]
MARPDTLPTGSELFTLLAKGEYRNQKEIADAYGVSEAAVSMKLAPFKEKKIDYKAILPWQVLPEHWRNPRPARSLRLHLRSKLENHTLSAAEVSEHDKWLDSLESQTLNYSQEAGWVYVPRTPEHGDSVAFLPSGNDLAPETVDLYRMGANE